LKSNPPVFPQQPAGDLSAASEEAGAKILVRKLDEKGDETWRYQGQVLGRGNSWVRLQAYFNREDLPFHGLLLGQGDRFVETFYNDRWYNIFAIHDRQDDRLKGWYCNIGYPAEITADSVAYRDLALDLLVFPDGRQLVLDQDEFLALDLEPQDRSQALAALQELQVHFNERV
jgi:hypothetical protein